MMMMAPGGGGDGKLLYPMDSEDLKAATPEGKPEVYISIFFVFKSAVE